MLWKELSSEGRQGGEGSESMSLCLGRVGCNFKHGDREGCTEKLAFKQIDEELGKACVKA